MSWIELRFNMLWIYSLNNCREEDDSEHHDFFWSRKYYVIGWKLIDVGERKCGFDGCNALEFRTTGYCLRHKDGEKVMKNTGEGKESTSIEWILFLVGIPISLFGYRVMQVEPISHWFENLINPIVQICGIGSLLLGVSLLLSPVFAKVLAGKLGYSDD